MLRSLLNRFHKDTGGASLLELSLLVPVLIPLGMGAAQFGDVIYRKHMIDNGIRDAARYAARLRYDGTAAASTANQTLAQHMATRGVISGGTNKISWWNPAAVTLSYAEVTNGGTSCGVTGTPDCFRGLGEENKVYVVTASTSVAYPTSGILGFLHNTGALSSATITLNSSHQERVLYGEQP